MGEEDEVVKLRVEARIDKKHMHVVITNKSILYGPNRGSKSQFVSRKLPFKEGIFIILSSFPFLYLYFIYFLFSSFRFRFFAFALCYFDYSFLYFFFFSHSHFFYRGEH